MFLVIYSIYIDAFNFVWKNLYLILVLLVAGVVSISLGGFSSLPVPFVFSTVFWLFAYLFVPCLVDIYLIVHILKSSGFMLKDDSILEVINRFYKKGLLIYIFGYLLAFLITSPFLLSFSALSRVTETNNLFILFLLISFFNFMVFVGVKLPLIILITKKKSPLNAFGLGFTEIGKHFHYYFLVFAFGSIVELFPSLITPIGIIGSPLFQIAEYNLAYQSNIFLDILYIFIQICVFVAFVYAFLHKNNLESKLSIQNRKS
ncbi:MAG: hypothetical protein JNK81_11120 [Anaerolineales bacterium]|nr:hypothetical protein [Anaerolineales bacterium]